MVQENNGDAVDYEDLPPSKGEGGNFSSWANAGVEGEIKEFARVLIATISNHTTVTYFDVLAT